MWKVSAPKWRERVKELAARGRALWCYEDNYISPSRGFSVSQYAETLSCEREEPDKDILYIAQYKNHPCLIQMAKQYGDVDPFAVVIPFCGMGVPLDMAHDVHVESAVLPPFKKEPNYTDSQYLLYSEYLYAPGGNGVETEIYTLSTYCYKGWAFTAYRQSVFYLAIDVVKPTPAWHLLAQYTEEELQDFVREHIPHEDKNGNPISCPDFGSTAEIPHLQREIPDHLRKLLDFAAISGPQKVAGPEPEEESSYLVAEQSMMCYRTENILWRSQYKNALVNKRYPFLSNM